LKYKFKLHIDVPSGVRNFSHCTLRPRVACDCHVSLTRRM